LAGAFEVFFAGAEAFEVFGDGARVAEVDYSR
jgi:hypothetical protein